MTPLFNTITVAALAALAAAIVAPAGAKPTIFVSPKGSDAVAVVTRSVEAREEEVLAEATGESADPADSPAASTPVSADEVTPVDRDEESTDGPFDGSIDGSIGGDDSTED